MTYVNNYSEPVTLAPGATTLALALPDGDYRLTLSDAERTRWEIVLATVSAGSATLTRAQEGTADQDWPAGSVIYCDLTAGVLNDMLARLAAAEAAIVALQPAPGLATTDGYFTASAGGFNTELNRWEVPPGTTFTATNPGALETDTYGSSTALIAFADGNYVGGSNLGDYTWSGSFTFANAGTITGNDNGSMNHIERYYYADSDGYLTSITVDVPSPPDDMTLYVQIYLNVQS